MADRQSDLIFPALSCIVQIYMGSATGRHPLLQLALPLDQQQLLSTTARCYASTQAGPAARGAPQAWPAPRPRAPRS